MVLGFIFDVPFLTDDDGNHYSVNLGERLWKTRYLNHFDKIIVIGRQKKVECVDFKKYSKSNSAQVVFKCVDDASKIKRIFNQKKESLFITESIKECDIVVVRSWWGVKECLKLKKPVVFEVITDAFDVMWNHSFLGKIVALPYYFKQKRAIRKSNYVIYVTNEYLQRKYPTKSLNIGISDVMLEDYSKEILEKRMKKISSQNNKIVLGTAAAVDVKFKGQKFVLKALHKLKARGINNFEYQLVGSGDPSYLRTIVKKLKLEDCVSLIGQVNHESMWKWYDSIDIYIQPSFQEGLPRSMIEAMSRGLLCIGTDTGGIPELIEKRWICKKRICLSNRILKLLINVNKKALIEEAVRNHSFVKRFTEKNVNQIRNDFFAMVIEDVKKNTIG